MATKQQFSDDDFDRLTCAAWGHSWPLEGSYIWVEKVEGTEVLHHVMLPCERCGEVRATAYVEGGLALLERKYSPTPEYQAFKKAQGRPTKAKWRVMFFASVPKRAKPKEV